MSGVRLEAKVHIVTGAESAAQNIVKCVQRCGLEVEDIVLEQLASSYATLADDEKELGVCLIDIGGGTTDIAVFAGGAIRHTAVIPIAGDQVTNDIAREPAHADAPRRGTQGQVRVRAVAARERRRDDRGAERRRSPAAAARAADARERRRGALRGDLRAGARRTARAPVSTTRSRPASCSRAAAPRWTASSSSPRKSSTRRCGSACRRA